MAAPPSGASSPRVTVILATYNWSSVLPYSIGSVLRQTFTDFELLVVGDGCTDDSASVVASIRDPRVRWINLPRNMGHQSEPNNEGLRQARGSIIAYLGHDDLWLPHHLEIMLAAIDAGADMAHSIAQLIDADGNVMTPPRGLLRYEPGYSVPPSCVVHRRAATERVGGWRDFRILSVDPETDLWQRMYQAGFVIRDVPRLTAVKFPASRRRDAYKKRLCGEQEFWTNRIRNEPNLEAKELGKLLIASERQMRPTRISVIFQSLLRRTKPDSAGRRFLFSVRSALSLGRLTTPDRGGVIRRIRQFKGLPNAN